MAKVCIISTVDLSRMTMVSVYTDYLENNNIKYDIIYADKYQDSSPFKAAKLWAYHVEQYKESSFPIKLAHYWRMRKFVKHLLRENHYDFAVVWGELAAFIFADILKNMMPGKYCLNIRDYFYNEIFFVQSRLKTAVRGAAFSTVSSDAYLRYLPAGNYIQLHSLNHKIVDSLQPSIQLREKGKPIRILYIGLIARLSYAYKMIDALGNDSRFELIFAGIGVEDIDSYIIGKNYTNIKTQGRFPQEETAKYLQEADILYNLYGHNNKHFDTALSIKLYYALYLNIPIMVFEGTYTKTVAEQCGLAFVVNGEDYSGLGEQLYNWYYARDPQKTAEKCREYLQTVNQSHIKLHELLHKYISSEVPDTRKKVFMMVYNDIHKDARVMRAALALSRDFMVYLYAVGSLKEEGIISIPVANCRAIGGVKANIKFIFGAVKTCKKIKPDIVYGHDIFSAIPLMLLKALSRKYKVIYDAHELFLRQPEKQYPLIDRMQYWFEAKAIKKADLVICAQKQRAKIMQEYHGLGAEPLVVRNISYLPVAKDEVQEENFQMFFDIPAFSVIYAGGMLAGRRLDALIQAIDNAGEEYKLMLVGDGPDYSRLEKIIAQRNNPNIIIRHGVPYAQLHGLLSRFDAGYLYYSTDDVNNLYCAPNKIYEYASIHLPIIANENPTVMDEVRSFGIGVCNNDIEAAIKEIRHNKSAIVSNMPKFMEMNSQQDEQIKLVNGILNLYKEAGNENENKQGQ